MNEEDILKKYNNSYYEYYCNYLFPQAIEYGMSADEFWKDDPQLFVSFRTSFFNKKKREMEELDYKSWLDGLYTYDGNSKLAASLNQTISNGFIGFSKTPRFNKEEIPTYTKKPYTELQKEEQKDKDKNKNYDNYQNSLIYFGSLKKVYMDKLLNKDKKGE